jgi:hypothetical protein
LATLPLLQTFFIILLQDFGLNYTGVHAQMNKNRKIFKKTQKKEWLTGFVVQNRHYWIIKCSVSSEQESQAVDGYTMSPKRLFNIDIDHYFSSEYLPNQLLKRFIVPLW